jgi:hypothetical protein
VTVSIPRLSTREKSRYPLVRPEDVKVGTYLVDLDRGQMFHITDTLTEDRVERSLRIVLLEDIATGEIESRELGSLAGLRVVKASDG